jgi:hypothetical protein
MAPPGELEKARQPVMQVDGNSDLILASPDRYGT